MATRSLAFVTWEDNSVGKFLARTYVEPGIAASTFNPNVRQAETDGPLKLIERVIQLNQ